ncbi:MAG TPA: hypothetical protein VKD72_39905 [Gemmataceae bacterium]|nr:hypothetical protein [Gemmataceae bacterium]
MRNLCKVSLSLALVALLASPALAQRQPRPGGGFRGGNLLTNKSVQEELKLSKEQKDKLEEAGKTVREKMQKAREEFQDLKPEEIREKFAALQKETNEILNKAASLSNDQKKRLAEITLQQSVRFRGPAALSSEDVQKQLKLTDDQKDAIKTIVKETQDKIREETKDLEMQDFRKRIEITQKLNKEAMGAVAKKLTKEQKETWTKMLGEPFEVKFEQPRRPGGGRNRPGGGARPPRTDL